nr:hypothetical protein [Nostoc sp. CreGUA01]
MRGRGDAGTRGRGEVREVREMREMRKMRETRRITPNFSLLTPNS